MKRYKVPLIIPAIFALAFIGIIIYENVREPRYKVLAYYHELPLTRVEENYVRGAIYINDTLVAGLNSQLVENKSGIDPLDGINPENSFLTKEERGKLTPRLSDLAYPYSIYKKKNNDTLIVIKNDTDTLKYTLSYQLDDANPLDTLTFKDLFNYIFKKKK